MTPDKRATLLTAFKWLTGLTAASLLLYGGYITQDVWLAALGVG